MNFGTRIGGTKIEKKVENSEFRTKDGNLQFFVKFLVHCELDRQVLRKEYRQKGL